MGLNSDSIFLFFSTLHIYIFFHFSMALNNNNIIIECNNNVNNNVNNTEEISPAKPKRERKEKKDKEKIKTTKSAKKSASSSKLVSENELVDQVSAKLRLWEQQQQKVIVPTAEVCLHIWVSCLFTVLTKF